MEKLILEKENLGKPTNPKILINLERASETIPQAWENNGNWYYNWEGAIQEAEYLGKNIPTKEQWKEIVKDYGDDGLRLSKELNLPFSGYRNWYNGSMFNQSTNGSYWSSSPTSTTAFDLFFYSTGINPSNGNNRALGFSVRCFKNLEDEFIN